MAELKMGMKFSATVVGRGKVIWEVTALLPGGLVELTEEGTEYTQQVSAARLLPPATGYSMATAPVAGLQPDPPAHLARFADKGIAVLPSPVAPETDKSGIVPTGEVKVLGTDGMLHVVPEQSAYPVPLTDATRLVRED
jgi:hypothetical protein